MHLLIAFLLTVLASVFAQAQDAVSSVPSPAPSPAPATYSSCHVDGPYIAMTFDDGPSPGNATRLLDIFEAAQHQGDVLHDRNVCFIGIENSPITFGLDHISEKA